MYNLSLFMPIFPVNVSNVHNLHLELDTVVFTLHEVNIRWVTLNEYHCYCIMIISALHYFFHSMMRHLTLAILGYTIHWLYFDAGHVTDVYASEDVLLIFHAVHSPPLLLKHHLILSLSKHILMLTLIHFFMLDDVVWKI